MDKKRALKRGQIWGEGEGGSGRGGGAGQARGKGMMEEVPTGRGIWSH